MPLDNKRDYISIIYNQENNSPKYFELKKSKLLLFAIGLPTLTIISLGLGALGLVHTSPFHLIDNYRQNAKAREAISKTNDLLLKIQRYESEKGDLTNKLAQAEEKLSTIKPIDSNQSNATNLPINGAQNSKSVNNGLDQKVTITQGNSQLGLTSLSLFKPVPGQQDKSRPATLKLSGFQIITNRDTINLVFNIIPAIDGEGKLAGHIIVLMKNELGIQAYPQQVIANADSQINFSSGESFATQRFRPVDASFLKPRKSGNYTFTVYIFAKNGDLVHYQNLILPVKI